MPSFGFFQNNFGNRIIETHTDLLSLDLKYSFWMNASCNDVSFAAKNSCSEMLKELCAMLRMIDNPKQTLLPRQTLLRFNVQINLKCKAHFQKHLLRNLQ